VKSYFTVRVLQDGKQFGKFETKAKGEETLIEQGWKASQIKGSYYKGLHTATVVPWDEPLPLEELEQLFTKDR
jgi:hypothetical protein